MGAGGGAIWRPPGQDSASGCLRLLCEYEPPNWNLFIFLDSQITPLRDMTPFSNNWQMKCHLIPSSTFIAVRIRGNRSIGLYFFMWREMCFFHSRVDGISLLGTGMGFLLNWKRNHQSKLPILWSLTLFNRLQPESRKGRWRVEWGNPACVITFSICSSTSSVPLDKTAVTILEIWKMFFKGVWHWYL